MPQFPTQCARSPRRIFVMPIEISEQQWQNLFRFAYSLCQHREDALDLVHSAIERLLRVKSTQPLQLEAYLRQVIRHLHYDRWRRQQRTPVHEPLADDQSVVDTSDQALEQVIIQRQQLAAIWSQLTAEQRDIIYLWAWLGFTTQEVADELQLPKGTVLARIHRLRQRLLAAGAQAEVGADNQSASRE